MNWKSLIATGEAPGIVRKTFFAGIETVTKSEDGNDVVTFVISTGEVDRHGDTIDVNGWDLESYRKNPVVLWQHDPYPGPIGRGLNVRVEDGVLKADVVFSQANPLGVLARGLVEEGNLRAVSVGFRIVEWKVNEDRAGYMPMDITRAELWEFSAVSIPANPGALVDGKGSETTLYTDIPGRVKTPPYTDIPNLEVLIEECKAGRVLSQSNFDRLARARDEINEVLSAAEPAEDKSTQEIGGSAVIEIVL